ncbi:hypothetical protein G3567_02075 [Psychroflexus sp. YR1-1]|uniref:Lipoprotein n=1 Tax=Psychroflexus aurantiacus TaxID=2709310 RepID=A0A6B3QYS2_9FLAO|nr:hypothetical protein [Psychroflexus aurantiacus]NEV92932.1 hypothetical protein [Psychroflexus aurantiacus]
MKYLSQFFIACLIGSLFFASCDSEDDTFFQSTEVSPILAANIPDTMRVGEAYVLEITYEKKSDCHRFSGFEAEIQQDSLYFVRAITIFTQKGGISCIPENEGVPREVNFNNGFESDFTFKFLTANDSLGQPVFIDKKVIVIE